MFENFLIGLLSNFISAAIIAYLVIKLIKIPNFKLHLDYIKERKEKNIYISPALDISVTNKRRLLWQIGFSSQEVNFGLFIPVGFVQRKKLFLISNMGEVEWRHDLEGKNIFFIDGEKYYQFRGMVNLPLYPDSRINFLRIMGDFFNDKKVKIYYYFNTPFGRFPRSLKFGEVQKSAENKKLPFVEIEL